MKEIKDRKDNRYTCKQSSENRLVLTVYCVVKNSLGIKDEQGN